MVFNITYTQNYASIWSYTVSQLKCHEIWIVERFRLIAHSIHLKISWCTLYYFQGKIISNNATNIYQGSDMTNIKFNQSIWSLLREENSILWVYCDHKAFHSRIIMFRHTGGVWFEHAQSSSRCLGWTSSLSNEKGNALMWNGHKLEMKSVPCNMKMNVLCISSKHFVF